MLLNYFQLKDFFFGEEISGVDELNKWKEGM